MIEKRGEKMNKKIKFILIIFIIIVVMLLGIIFFRYNILKDILTPKEYQVVLLRFGFINNNPLVRPLIAEIMNITHQRVSQLENSALEKIMKSKLFDQYIQSYDDYQEKLAILALRRK